MQYTSAKPQKHIVKHKITSEKYNIPVQNYKSTSAKYNIPFRNIVKHKISPPPHEIGLDKSGSPLN